MTETILVLNAGSSSVKFQLFKEEDKLPLLARGATNDIGGKPIFKVSNEETHADLTQALPIGDSHEHAVRHILDWVHAHENGWHICAVAHRIVHGGKDFSEPICVTSSIFHRLKKLCPLAPLHQPHNLATLGITERLLPHVPQIACFDTAFHAHHDPLFSLYALPQHLTDQGIRRYGFHGLSYEWIAHVLREDYPASAGGRVIAAHLGNGASICAMKDGQSLDTTMGMTALDGLPMGTRSGALDPAAVLYMIQNLKISPSGVEHILYEESGLKGLSGLTNDVKVLLDSQDPKAQFALDYFTLKIAQYVAMMAVSLGGVDTLVFTGGIGENAAPIRDAVLRHLEFLGPRQTLIIPANEERMMAMHAQGCLGLIHK